ncbi:hypothetical protein [Actinacidiphila yeochonensis]|uniref:hypothetical protein n=1 Tax=Actinacidiphila yeochonensis TaxID=89050 RepID=UPI002AFE6E02|nr:hypothetical protein [Actinacidiphila yeochonensis]
MRGNGEDEGARQGHLADCAGAIATAACQAAHGVLAARGTWVADEKHLLASAGLRDVDGVLAGLTGAPAALAAAVDAAVDAAAELLGSAVAAAWPGTSAAAR